MQQDSLFSRLGSEVCLTWARLALAASLALSLAFTPHLFLRGLIGSLGMYALTDGVFAALSRPHAAERYARLEGALSFVLGIVIMLADTQRELLALFCARNLLVASGELLLARKASRAGDWFKLQAPGAFLAYAALSASALSVGLMLAAYLGYGALDLILGVAGQLALWAGLIGAHAARSARLRQIDEPVYPVAARFT